MLCFYCFHFRDDKTEVQKNDITGLRPPQLDFIAVGGKLLFHCFMLDLLVFFFSFLNWSIIALQCCVSCCCKKKRISHMYTYVPSLLDLAPRPIPPFQVFTEHRAGLACVSDPHLLLLLSSLIHPLPPSPSPFSSSFFFRVILGSNGSTSSLLQQDALRPCLNRNASKVPGPRFYFSFPSQVAQMVKKGPDGKASASSAGDLGLIPGLGGSLGGGNGNALQCSCLEHPMDRGAWQAIVHGFAKSRTRLSDFTSCVCLFKLLSAIKHEEDRNHDWFVYHYMHSSLHSTWQILKHLINLISADE